MEFFLEIKGEKTFKKGNNQPLNNPVNADAPTLYFYSTFKNKQRNKQKKKKTEGNTSENGNSM